MCSRSCNGQLLWRCSKPCARRRRCSKVLCEGCVVSSSVSQGAWLSCAAFLKTGTNLVPKPQRKPEAPMSKPYRALGLAPQWPMPHHRLLKQAIMDPVRPQKSVAVPTGPAPGQHLALWFDFRKSKSRSVDIFTYDFGQRMGDDPLRQELSALLGSGDKWALPRMRGCVLKARICLNMCTCMHECNMEMYMYITSQNI